MMRQFAKNIFEMCQTVPENEKIAPRSYLPGRTAATSPVKEISDSLRNKFVSDVQGSLVKYGGAITIDGAHLKMQGKHYYDFAIHFMEIIAKDHLPTNNPRFEISDFCLQEGLIN